MGRRKERREKKKGVGVREGVLVGESGWRVGWMERERKTRSRSELWAPIEWPVVTRARGC